MPFVILNMGLTPNAWYAGPNVGWTNTLGVANTYATKAAADAVINQFSMFALSVSNPPGVSGNVVGPASSATGNAASFADGSGTSLQDSGLKIVAPGGTATFAGHTLTLTADSWIGGTAGTGSSVAFSGARVRQTTDVTLTKATPITIPFPAERYDTDNYHDNVTNNSRLTVPADGKYHIGTNILAFCADAQPMSVSVKINHSVDGEIARALVYTDGILVTQSYVVVCCDYQMTAGQYVQVIVQVDKAGSDAFALHIPNSVPEFWIHAVH